MKFDPFDEGIYRGGKNPETGPSTARGTIDQEAAAVTEDRLHNELALIALRRYVARNGETSLQNEQDAGDYMDAVVADYRASIGRLSEGDLPEGETHVSFERSGFTGSDDFRIKRYFYSSEDPFKNTAFSVAADHLALNTIALTELLSASDNPVLTYLDSQRGKGGKKDTVVTKKIKTISEGVNDWVTGLPAAERLRIVAHPRMDTKTLINTKNGIQEIDPDFELVAMVGGGNDGIAVREREAWEKTILIDKLAQSWGDKKKIVISSLGTGTGEPAVDSGITLASESDNNVRLKVYGFDVNPDSKKVAKKIAAEKTEEHRRNGLRVSARFMLRNILSPKGIRRAVGKTDADVVEAIGFSEYVPSDYATRPEEQKQREFMKKLGCLSAEEYYSEIYKNMKEGALFITGNMRNDSSQASFVLDGLGWKGIIQRSTEEYIEILRKAGIPADAIELYEPDATDSSGVYNLVCITKI